MSKFNSIFKTMGLFQPVEKAGTSEGAKRAWETRRGGAPVQDDKAMGGKGQAHIVEDAENGPVHFVKDTDGHISAVWPNVTADNSGNIQAFDSTSGHGAASKGWLKGTTPATPEEYKSTYEHLKTAYGYKLGDAPSSEVKPSDGKQGAPKKMGGSFGDNTPDARDKAYGEAFALRDQANKSGTPEHHKAAADAFTKLADMQEPAGFDSAAKYNREMAAHHEGKAKGVGDKAAQTAVDSAKENAAANAGGERKAGEPSFKQAQSGKPYSDGFKPGNPKTLSPDEHKRNLEDGKLQQAAPKGKPMSMFDAIAAGMTHEQWLETQPDTAQKRQYDSQVQGKAWYEANVQHHKLANEFLSSKGVTKEQVLSMPQKQKLALNKEFKQWKGSGTAQQSPAKPLSAKQADAKADRDYFGKKAASKKKYETDPKFKEGVDKYAADWKAKNASPQFNSQSKNITKTMGLTERITTIVKSGGQVE